jgi:hypothetical protein
MIDLDKPDRTRNERQTRRRDREKQWLRENGWSSWEALHTALMKGDVILAFINSCHSQQNDHRFSKMGLRKNKTMKKLLT